MSHIYYVFIYIYNFWGHRGAGAQVKGDCKRSGDGFDSHLGQRNIFISSLWPRDKAQRWVPTLNMPPEFGGAWSTEVS